MFPSSSLPRWFERNHSTSIPINDDAISDSISPLSLSHADTPPNAPCQKPKLGSKVKAGNRAYETKYSKQQMVYRAIDEKIDLVRFLQAYEAVLAAFGVESEENEERGRKKLEVAERIVYRLFWNDKSCARGSGSKSVPLARAKAGNPLPTEGTSRAMRVTTSETDAISAIVDEGLLRIPAEPAVDNILEKDELISTVTEVKESNEVDELMTENLTNSMVEEGVCVAAELDINLNIRKNEIISTVTEVVGLPLDINTSLVETATSGSLNGGPFFTTGVVANVIDEKDRIFSTVLNAAEVPRRFHLAIRSKSSSEATNGDSSIDAPVESEVSTATETLYEEIMKNPKILMLGRWGRHRYNEWVQENDKAKEAQEEDIKKEIFRQIELKHKLLPLEWGRLPYTYSIASSARNHGDSCTTMLWGVNPVQRTEELLNVRFQWSSEEGILTDITAEPIDIDEFAVDKAKGHKILKNAFAFLGFWDWAVRQDMCSSNRKVKPMHQLCLQWIDPNNILRRAYLQKTEKRPDSNSSERVKREREVSMGRNCGSWREKRTVSGASYVGGKRRSGSGGWSRGKKRTASGNSCKEGKERNVGKEDNLSKGLRKVKRRTATEMMDA
ncbi:919ab256-136b-4475-a568-57b833c50828 [Sclerotinia trifoliorum]|uniref:919ab256-136b-4475-a568-57b833c50828 n=1 Tax=Sclerotinia trifoliorum TaxID=28548 RepID=A0A8H2ZPG2_9HELO|nr:919ab256-136b-4475-a568-57b833c50828 [Sclerotinia trifoliorum]